ncbi:MAG: hypothetical protein MZW92_60255 [Comamonadaceae bacterium]|nr:hypothetical protein [Comamonadaceae bacterium]
MLFSSRIVAPTFELLAAEIPEFAVALERVEVILETVDDNAFGGNYDPMDSRVIPDYAKVIRKRLHQGVRPDLILIPDAFGGAWGFDVFGNSEADLSLEFGIPVERIEWQMVYGRDE